MIAIALQHTNSALKKFLTEDDVVISKAKIAVEN
jgi:hypothetical protein